MQILYITYFSKLRDIPEGAKKQIITRFPPKWVDVSKTPNTFINKALSPSQSILLQYKKDKDWDKYTKSFNEEMNDRGDLVSMLGKLEAYLKSGKDVYLICYEKDYEKCHRYLIAKHLESKGIKWEEFQNPDSKMNALFTLVEK